MKRHLTRFAAHTHTLSLSRNQNKKNPKPWTPIEEEEVARFFYLYFIHEEKKELGNVYKDAPVGQGRFVK